jgi:hypothetical protein
MTASETSSTTAVADKLTLGTLLEEASDHHAHESDNYHDHRDREVRLLPDQI